MQYFESVDSSAAKNFEVAGSDPKYHLTNKTPKRVLLVEDCKHTQALLARMLQKLGLAVVVAGDGEKFMEHAFASETTGEPFDMVLLDINLPKLNGLEATRLLRKSGYNKPIVAITAGPSLHDRRDSIQSGCDSFLAKSELHLTLPPLMRRYLNAH